MGRPEAVKIAFTPFGKAIESVALPDFPDFVAAAGEDLVGVGLVADVPNDPVFRRLEDIVQGNRKLDNAKPRAEMPACRCRRINGFRPQFGSHLGKIALRQFTQIGRQLNGIQKGGRNRHENSQFQCRNIHLGT